MENKAESFDSVVLNQGSTNQARGNMRATTAQILSGPGPKPRTNQSPQNANRHPVVVNGNVMARGELSGMHRGNSVTSSQ